MNADQHLAAAVAAIDTETVPDDISAVVLHAMVAVAMYLQQIVNDSAATAKVAPSS
ncbi:hypothetical protein FGG30_gp003 [Mycobacterium phage Pixie]|uniref:Uncharacterized protein n=2 Tax=Keshuvirus pixie TaxID=1034114 RepID=G1D512_9CAUD|nr:hypothetical protein FGG30_gp003 [Mycobacterium phage Pixie]AEK09815.1 hypothetical protein PBI_PIXIE_3 [Mycobacterium phage Pixie]AOT23837.1 hypothetical protein SEA_TBOND007_3 [Mycobacterium phage TBond007]